MITCPFRRAVTERRCLSASPAARYRKVLLDRHMDMPPFWALQPAESRRRPARLFSRNA